MDHIFGPSSGTLGPIPKKILMDDLPIMAGYWSKFQPSRSNTVPLTLTFKNSRSILCVLGESGLVVFGLDRSKGL